MKRSRQAIAQSLGIISFSLVQISFPFMLPQESKAIPNFRNSQTNRSEKNLMISSASEKSFCSKIKPILQRREKLDLSLLPNNSPSKNSPSKQNPYPKRIAQTYLGTVAGGDIYQDDSGWIIVFIGGVESFFDSIGDALTSLASTLSGDSSRQYKCEFVGEFTTPGASTKTCSYNCKGYGALANFPWPVDQPCPPSFNGDFPGP